MKWGISSQLIQITTNYGQRCNQLQGRLVKRAFQHLQIWRLNMCSNLFNQSSLCSTDRQNSSQSAFVCIVYLDLYYLGRSQNQNLHSMCVTLCFKFINPNPGGTSVVQVTFMETLFCQQHWSTEDTPVGQDEIKLLWPPLPPPPSLCLLTQLCNISPPSLCQFAWEERSSNFS